MVRRCYIINKLSTGIQGLDELLFGGIVQGNSVLVEGPPGAGKTTFGIEFIYRGATVFDEPGVVITCEQFPESIYRDAFNFGWDLSKLEKLNKLRIVCTSPEVLMDADESLVEEIVREVGARRVLVDSITHFRNVVNEPLVLRQAVYSFCNGLKRMGLTTFLVKERELNSASPTGFEEYVVDTVIHLNNHPTVNNGRRRFLEISKTRGQEHIPGQHTFRITDSGIKVFALEGLVAARNEKSVENVPSSATTASGISGLDELMRGGIPKETTLAVIGPPGTGKTVLGLQFLVQGAYKENQKGIFLTMEETPEQLINTANNFGWNLPALQEKNMIKFFYRTMLDIEIDETIIELGNIIKKNGIRRVVIDSLLTLLSRMENLAQIREKVYYLTTYLNSLGCNTLLLLPDVHNETGIQVVQSIVQGTMLLKSTLHQNHRIRQLELYKLRGVNHVTGNHLLEINSSGVAVYPRTGGC